jgi:hypothetical protein
MRSGQPALHTPPSALGVPAQNPVPIGVPTALNPETVNEGIIARATAKNPTAAQKLNELTEIRAMHVTVAGHAAAEVKEALSSYNLDK